MKLRRKTNNKIGISKLYTGKVLEDFSITTEFFDLNLAFSILLIVFLELPEIDNFSFFFSIFHLSISKYFVSSSHNKIIGFFL